MVQCNSKPLERSAATFDQDESSRSRMTIKQQWDVSWKEGIEKDKKRKVEHPRSGAGGIQLATTMKIIGLMKNDKLYTLRDVNLALNPPKMS